MISLAFQTRKYLIFAPERTFAAACLFCLSTLSFNLQADGSADGTADAFTKDVVNPRCVGGLLTERATIERVTDGDTVVLTDQRRVRLIGINSAELNARNPALKKAARQATDKLRALLPQAEPVMLHLGTEPLDRHGRVLAHLIREKDGLAVAHWMVQHGLALQSAVAPTTRCTADFVTLENQAIESNLGLWKIRDQMSINAKNLTSSTRGFKLVSGTVTSVNRQSRYTEIYLENRLQLKIRPTLAKQMQLQSLKGQKIEVRGWLSQNKNKTSLWLQHSANLSLLDN